MDHQCLCQQIGYQFKQPALLQKALTHRSYSGVHNERLEFLGDSVLNCVIAKYLFERYPELPEGQLSRLRSNLVNQQTLAVLAQQIDLGKCLLLGDGERKSAGYRRPSILADALEALFGGIFMDAGFAAAEQVILKLYIPLLATTDIQTLGKDAKTLLQECLQARKLAVPKYSVVSIHGEAHAQTFEVECEIEKLAIVTHGSGSSRRIAEQMAAEAAYKKISS